MGLRRLQSEMVYSATAMVEQNLQLLIIHWNLLSEMYRVMTSMDGSFQS